MVRSEGPPLIQPEAVVNYTEVVGRGDVTALAVTYGSVRLVDRNVSFGFEGEVWLPIGEVFARPGDAVYEGQLLATLDMAHIDERIERREESIAEMRLAHSVSNRRQSLAIDARVLEHRALHARAEAGMDASLFEQAGRLADSIHMLELALDQAMEIQADELREANRLLELERRNLDGSRLYAPFSGTVTVQHQHPGSHVRADDPVFAIAPGDMEPVVEWFGVWLELWRIGQFMEETVGLEGFIDGEPVELEFREFTPEDIMEFTRISLLSGRPDVSAPIWFRVVGGEPPPLGAFVRIVIYTARYEDVLRIPQNTVFHHPAEGHFVYRITDEGRVRTPIDATATSTYLAVHSGLEEGDVLFVRPTAADRPPMLSD